MELQDKSKTRVQNWPNTISALRKKKDEDRIRRLEEEEIERRKVDALEYELQVQSRTKALESANKHMHNSKDQVKAFHSKMLLCDVLQERDIQGQLKKRKQDMDRHIEEQWMDLEKQKMEEYDEKLRNKLMTEYDKKMMNSKVVKDQLYDYKMTCIKRMQEEQLEGELIRR
jgi:phosphopantetheine adenylyltransferase